MAPPSRIFITGYGLITPLGTSAWETFAALLKGRTITDRCAHLPAEIDAVDLVRAIGSVASAQHAGDDPAVELAERATREACAAAAIEPRGLPCFLGTSKGAFRRLDETASRFARRRSAKRGAVGKASGLSSVEPASRLSSVEPTSRNESETPYGRDARPTAIPHPDIVALGPHGYLAAALRRRMNLGDMHHTVAACASSLAALHRARAALLNGRVEGDRALVVTADAALTPLFIHSYRRLGVLAPLTAHEYGCLSLDRHRRGFVLAEAGAAVVLHRIDADHTPPPHAVELLDTATACDASDLIRASADMPALRRVARTLLADRRIDLLHPHAPGTREQDDAELRAYADGLGNSAALPDLYASKGALGHALGAAGLVSLVIACLCARTGRRPPMPWLADPIAPARSPATNGRSMQTQAVFAAGFGGHVAGAVIGLPRAPHDA